MTVLETERLILSRLSYGDCEFIYELVNEAAFKKYIGDKNVNSVEDAHSYLKNGPIGSYEQHGFGMFLVTAKDSSEALGICGLVKREQFPEPDLGFAFLRRFWDQGYALESSRAVLEYGVAQLALRRIIAIADPENSASVRLIEKLGFGYAGPVRMAGEARDIHMFALETT